MQQSTKQVLTRECSHSIMKNPGGKKYNYRGKMSIKFISPAQAWSVKWKFRGRCSMDDVCSLIFMGTKQTF